MDSTTAAGKSLSTDRTATSPGPSIATALPATSPTGTTQASTLATTMTPPAPLKDCLGGTAACTFIPTSTARSNYAEMTPLSLPLENCNDSNVTVTGHFSGAVTVTDNWSVEVEAGTGFSLPGLLEIGLNVKTSFEKGKEIEMEQAFDYPIPPNTKAALVGSASFIGIFGSMEMNYRGSDSQTVNNVVYFKSAENPNPVGLLMTVGCDQPWPVWNATPAVPTTIWPESRDGETVERGEERCSRGIAEWVPLPTMAARANATARATVDFMTFWRFLYSTPVTRDTYENFRIFEAL
ncbi:hypothetical protein DFH08DRAFT_939627 [Mycena albidolilacea]|uniref:Uncharacterized protein n=1 Tax=Mycena albidolilacea TaxID=1033008 RepID=A0AAD6ZR54_9AGAR|nr:hypothetical protein DFH08DRAFT_939627 [Mycena albidolilacea]